MCAIKFDWINQTRMASWWLNWKDLEWPDEGLEAEWYKKAKIFQEHGVNTVVMFGFHFRWDYVLIMERVLGILARISEICHEFDIRVVEHHSASLVHRVRNIEDRWCIRKVNHHHVPFYPDSWENLTFNGSSLADWRQVSAKDGKPVYVERYNAAAFCPNNPEYQKAYLKLIEWHIEQVEIDALMSDDMHFLNDVYSCACRYCRKKFFEETGMELPQSSDMTFWENKQNPAFNKWIELRYKWNTEHYIRLRNFLPENIALWGCASTCLMPACGDFGFGVQQWIFHWNAVAQEIYYEWQIDRDDEDIISELVSFASMARQINKPLVSLFYVNQPADVTKWLKLLRALDARPWLSKMVRSENAVPEEELMHNGFGYPDKSILCNKKPIVGIRFSQKLRDQLDKDLAAKYVKAFKILCNRLYNKGYQIEVIFDEFVSKINTLGCQEIWTLKPELTQCKIQVERME